MTNATTESGAQTDRATDRPRATFTDRNDQTWRLALDLPTIRKVKSVTGVNLTAIADAENIARLGDALTLGDTLGIICQRQIESRNLDEDAFAEAISNGETLNAAADALLEAILDFFPPRQRQTLAKAIDIARADIDDAMAKVETALDARTSSPPATNSADSSASAPTA